MSDERNQQPLSTIPGWLVGSAPLAIIAVIFFLSSQPKLPDLDGGRDIQSVAGHFFAYAALSASLAVLLRWLGWSAVRALLAAIVLATLYGVSDELHQSFVPNRHASGADVLVDFLGAAAGALAAMQLTDWRNASVSASLDADRARPGDESS